MKDTALTFDPLSEPIIFKEIVLNAMTFACQKRYTKNFLAKRQCDFDFFVGDFADDVVLQFKGIVYGSRTTTENPLEVPDGKLAYLKLAILPKWLLKKFPAKTKIIAQQITVYNSYPDVPVLDNSIRFRQYSD